MYKQQQQQQYSHPSQLIPSVCTLNTQEEDQQDYQLIQRKLQCYKDNLKIIQKNNEDDRKYLSSSSDVLQLTESQEDDCEQLKQQINFLQDELGKTKQNMMQIIEELTQQRDLLIYKIQELESTIDNLQQQKHLKNKSIHSTLLDITYEQDQTQDYGRKRTRSKYDDQNCWKRIFEELADMLKTENVIQEVHRLQQKCIKQDKFIGCVQDLVIKLTPKDIFEHSKPQLRDCWHWIKGICTEYMNLKKMQATLIVETCSQILNVQPQDIVGQIQFLIKRIIAQKN
ncbi:unnamed protein product [Paramecium primaurelia]|uniref:Uncharacterized protein n=1 Tax=Paramecium primaurelia TaxID=5886 RepID=A0A8S1QBC4_PARPR|nr:unnamed protein product [Paramecium primaurelia]